MNLSNSQQVNVSKIYKAPWKGRLLSIQPRISLIRSFDERSHNYLGYSLHLFGTLDGREGEFLVGIGKSARAKHRFRKGDLISGVPLSVADYRMDPVDYYKTSGLKGGCGALNHGCYCRYSMV